MGRPSTQSSFPSEPASSPRTLLVGAGVVGQAILQAHIDADVSVQLMDQDEFRLRQVIDELNLPADQWQPFFRPAGPLELPTFELHRLDSPDEGPLLVIESISERLAVKQAFFQQAREQLGDGAVLCSNTSTLRIGDVGASMPDASRLAGLHFFMPVAQRQAVEVVTTDATSSETLQHCQQHVVRLGKTALQVPDSPGFVVNRLLCPYLNEALLMLGRGIDAARIEHAALVYGMPLSPLELADWIGTRTMFDAGRVFWQAFPKRLDPAPLLAALVKRGRLGRQVGKGFYDYQGGIRSSELASEVIQLNESYSRNPTALSDEEVTLMLAVPMWIEAAMAWRDRTLNVHQHFDLAMSGGLGYKSGDSWLEFFDQIGSPAIKRFLAEHASTTKSLQTPAELSELLNRHQPSEAILAYRDGGEFQS